MNEYADKLIHEKGKQYYAGLLPKEIPRGKVGDCFDWCLVLALKHPEYQYCEGMVLIQGKWYYHAWLTKDGMTAVDPTWMAIDNKTNEEIPLSMAHYIGVKMDKMLVVEFMKKTEYKAVMKNYFRAPDIAQKIYDTAI